MKVLLSVLLEMPFEVKASETEVDDRRLHSLLADEDAHVILVEVHVHHAGRVHALEGDSHLLEDILQLGGREQQLLDALPERGAGEAADDNVVLALEDGGFNALHAVQSPDLVQGSNLPCKKSTIPAFHLLHHQLLVAARDQAGDSEAAGVQQGLAPGAHALQVGGLCPHGHLARLQLLQEGLHCRRSSWGGLLLDSSGSCVSSPVRRWGSLR